MFEAEFWVAVAFVLFMGVLGYFGVHKLMLKGIDDRRDRIKAELDEARRIKAEAQALLAQYQRRQRKPSAGAAIVTSAKAEAERLAAEAAARSSFVARRPRWRRARLLRPKRKRWPMCVPPPRTPPSPGRNHPHADGQGQGCRRPHRQGHRRPQGQA